jgi:hypothetical protein
MNRGIFGFPRHGALDARQVTAQTVTATTALRTAGTSAGNTGIKLLNDSDLGSLFRPASYTAFDTVSNSGSSPGSGWAVAEASLSMPNPFTVQLNKSYAPVDCNCNCHGGT